MLFRVTKSEGKVWYPRRLTLAGAAAAASEPRDGRAKEDEAAGGEGRRAAAESTSDAPLSPRPRASGAATQWVRLIPENIGSGKVTMAVLGARSVTRG
jgi:hypothetical protein